MKSGIRVIARALIFDDGRLLLAKDNVNGHAFLPGGGIESGEALQEGLKREIREEMGLEGSVQSAVGVFENTWTQKQVVHHELNFLFHVTLPVTVSDQTIQSLEDHIDFFWISIDDFKKLHFLPKELKPIVLQFVHHGFLNQFYHSNML